MRKLHITGHKNLNQNSKHIWFDLFLTRDLGKLAVTCLVLRSKLIYVNDLSKWSKVTKNNHLATFAKVFFSNTLGIVEIKLLGLVYYSKGPFIKHD